MDGSDAPGLMARAQAALESYDYDLARELLDAALRESRGGVEAARALLGLLVEVLGQDVEALALETRLGRQAARDEPVRSRLALAAARLGEVERALSWLEGVDVAEAGSALVACAKSDLAGARLERCQALLERARRLSPTEPSLAELERGLRDEKRFRVLVLEEELDGLVARGDGAGAEAAARALIARDGRNAKATALLEQVEAARAEARARELLEGIGPIERDGPPSGLARRAAELRAAAGAPLVAALREELLRRADALDARAARLASDEALERLMVALRAPELNVGELVARYLELPQEARLIARQRAEEPLLGWVDALELDAAPSRATLRGLEALRRAHALGEGQAEAALAVLEPELGSLRKLRAATELRARLTARVEGARRAAALDLLERADAALRSGDAREAARLLGQLPRAALDEQQRGRAEAASREAERRLARERRELAIRTHREQGRPLEARRAVEDLLASGLLDADGSARAGEVQSALDAEVQALFGVEKLAAPLGDWWRALLERPVTSSHAVWMCPALGRAVLPINAGRSILLVELDVATGEAAGATLLQLPAEAHGIDAFVTGRVLTLLSDQCDVLELILTEGRVASWRRPPEDASLVVEDCWPSRDRRRVWVERRHRDLERRDDRLCLFDLERQTVVAEFDGGMGIVHVAGHPQADIIVTHHGRQRFVDSSGRRIAGALPPNCSSAAIHPRADGLVSSSVDYEGSGALTLHELLGDQGHRTLELSDVSGEAPHFVGVSREAGIVAVLGEADVQELRVYRPTPAGLELLWRRECSPATVLLGDAECGALHVLHASRRPGAGWLSRVGDAPIEFDAVEVREPVQHRHSLWCCPASEDAVAERARQALDGLDLGSSSLAQAFLRELPADFSALRWLRSHVRELGLGATAHAFGSAELGRAFPNSPAVRLLLAQESAQQDRWDDVRRQLAELTASDVSPEDARHLCYLQGLSALQTGDTAAVLRWVDEGAPFAGECALESLEACVMPLPSTGSALRQLPPEAAALLRLRSLLRELDALLAAAPERVLEHPALRETARRPLQVVARVAAAWERVPPVSPELRARRTIEVAQLGERLRYLDVHRSDLHLPEAWSQEELLALHERLDDRDRQEQRPAR